MYLYIYIYVLYILFLYIYIYIYIHKNRKITQFPQFYVTLYIYVVTLEHWILFRCLNRLSYQSMSSTRTQSQLYTSTPVSSFSDVSYFISSTACIRHHIFLNQKIAHVVTWMYRKDECSIHHWKIFGSSYGKLARLRFYTLKSTELSGHCIYITRTNIYTDII